MRIQSINELEKAIGGRPKSKRKKIRVSFYLDGQIHELLKAYCDSQRVSVSEVIRTVVRSHLNSNIHF